MPFTPTHILAVLPLHFCFRKLPLPALAIGATIPDFAMFYPVVPSEFSHSPMGLIGYCLPSGLLVYFLFDLVGKVFLIDLTPGWVKSRIVSYRYNRTKYTVGNILLLAIAIIFGSITHIVWDAFTHQEKWGVELIPLLARQVEFANIVLPGYKLVQYGSTLIGLPLLAILGFFYLQKIEPNINYESYRFKKSRVLAIISSFLIMSIAIAAYHWYQAESFKSTVGNTIKQSIGAGIVLFFFYAVLYKIWQSKRKT